MDTQNTSRQLHYLEEVRIPLHRAGFGILPVEGEQLHVLWNGAPLCRITGKGSVFYRREDADTPQAEDALYRVEDIAAKTLEYMTAMESAPQLKASGLDGDYRILADFGGTVLAGTPSKYGIQFVTWDWDYDRTGVVHGHYFIGGIGYQEECSPTLKAAESGTNMVPSVLCLNDQGGSVMNCSENVSGTLRAQEHGHQPLVYENHGIDSRYTGPHKVAPTMSARYGTGGNNVPLVEQEADAICIAGNTVDRQPQNGGNGLGCQDELAYTLTATDRHCIYARQRVDEFKDGEVVSTQSARQYKDATDLICQQAEACAHLIRRLTPLECERLQGFPDGWTDIPGASDSARYKALGNSVAIPCVEFIMSRIAAALLRSTALTTGVKLGYNIPERRGDRHG